MPQVKVSREVTGKKSEVYRAVKLYLEERGPFDKYGASVEWDDESHSASIGASSFEGTLRVFEKAGMSHVEISVDLPFLLTPIKGKVEEELTKHLSRLKV